MDSRLSGFGNASGTDASSADLNAFVRTGHNRAYRLQIGVPAAAPRIVGVADYVSVARTFAAEFTLQCHGSSTSNLVEIADSKVYQTCGGAQSVG